MDRIFALSMGAGLRLAGVGGKSGQAERDRTPRYRTMDWKVSVHCPVRESENGALAGAAAESRAGPWQQITIHNDNCKW